MSQHLWVTRGFDDFRKGTFGNAGQNLYVSKEGVLQRIHQYDLNHNGHYDLLFCNSQAHCERMPAYLIRDVFGEQTTTELVTEGATAAAVCDLNGDGYDDLIVGCTKNGLTVAGSNAHIYYGSSEGWTEKYQNRLPAPASRAVAAGDFLGTGKPSIAFLIEGKLRFFHQGDYGFGQKRFIDIPFSGQSMDSADLDDDGFCDLVVRSDDGSVRVHWGSPEGIDPDAFDVVPSAEAGEKNIVLQNEDVSGVSLSEYVSDASPLVRVLYLSGEPWIFVPSEHEVRLVPIHTDRTFGKQKTLDCPNAFSAAVGDVDGDGEADLVIACRQPSGDDLERSWIYWGDPKGFSDDRKTGFDTYRACDIAVGDLDGDGRAEISVCQNKTHDWYTHASLVCRCTAERVLEEPLSIETHDARRTFIVGCSDDAVFSLVFVNHFSGTASDTVKSYLYYGGADGFSPDRCEEISASGAVEAICVDFDDDGWADLIMVNASEYSRGDEDPGSYALVNRKPGFPSQPDFVFPTTHAHGGACADLNRDGYLDVVFGGFHTPELLFFYGNDKGFDVENPVRLRIEHEGVVYDETRWIYLADLNNDGWLDLVVPQITSDRSFVLWGGPEGYSMDRTQVLCCYHAACARAADLTGNGYLDLIVGGHRQTFGEPEDTYVYIYWNGPNGLREDRKMLLPANAVNAMAVGDFNGDGTLDLFVGSYATDREREVPSYIYWNRPGTGFSNDDKTRVSTHSASGCVACDFDLDGHVDLAVANHKVDGDHTGWSAVYWNGPDGIDERRITRLPTKGPHGISCVGPGNIVDRGPEEYYTSTPFEIPDGYDAFDMSWEAEIPGQTWVHAQIRSAGEREDLEDAAWIGPDGAETWFETSGNRLAIHGNWIQYRLAIGALNSLRTPRVTEITLRWERT